MAGIKKNDDVLYVKLPSRIKILLTERADAECMTVSAYLRRLILDDLGLLRVQNVEIPTIERVRLEK